MVGDPKVMKFVHACQQTKVLLLSTQSGTAYSFVMPLAKHLRDKGYQVTMACSREPQADAPDFHDAIEQEGFPLLNVPIPRQVRPVADIKALRVLVNLLRNQPFDIVHTYNAKAGMLGRIAAHIAGVPYIVYTDLGLPFFKADNFSLAQSLTFWMMEAITARFTDRILTISSAEFKKAQRFHIACPPKLVNVGFGAKVDFFSKEGVTNACDTERVQQLRTHLAGRPVVGSVARLVPEKGIDCLLEAMAICVRTWPDLAVLILGDGPERNALEQKALELAVEKNVHFLGGIREHWEVRQLYSLMDIFALPTRWESFGIVFVEAMSMEIPVVGPKMEPITSVVPDGKAGYLVPPDDSSRFAEAILELLSNPNRRAKMGRAGRRHALDFWDERKTFARVESVYRELLF